MTNTGNAGLEAQDRAQFETRIKAEQIRGMLDYAGANLSLPVIALALLVVLHWRDSEPGLTVSIWLLYLLIDRRIVWLRKRFSAVRPADEETENWARQYTWLCLATSLCWCAAWFAFYHPDRFVDQALMAMVLVALATMSMIARAGYPPAFLAFGAPMGVVVVVTWLIQADFYAFTSIGLTSIYIYALLRYAGLNRRRAEDMIRLRFENEGLAAELTTARDNAIAARLRAEAGERAKTEFLAVMSHEVRTPLNGVIGMAQVLQSGRLSEEQRRQVELIEETGTALATVLNDVLELSRLEAGMTDLQAVELVPADLVNGVVALFRPTAEAKGLALEFEVDGRATVAVQGDAARLRQILLNLVANAIKFTPSGHVRVRCETRSLSQGRTLFDVSVSDTGIGIAERDRGRLFLPFSQADASIGRLYEGVGLGLAISKRLVERMGGEIGVESTEGVGSRFWFQVPLDDLDSRPANDDQRPAPNGDAQSGAAASSGL